MYSCHCLGSKPHKNSPALDPVRLGQISYWPKEEDHHSYGSKTRNSLLASGGKSSQGSNSRGKIRGKRLLKRP
ncbi:hypothetical protein GDO81_021631 [Engystomops pustulosus]|uniref:Uncharacterized protein n=1 Tax=Engystomops pustulosus TaxID=76066 RepID=A0AAV6YNI2_ENGPU|nr:hypothetical protein GDO81_021631 [Engystomops pustulosus]